MTYTNTHAKKSNISNEAKQHQHTHTPKHTHQMGGRRRKVKKRANRVSKQNNNKRAYNVGANKSKTKRK